MAERLNTAPTIQDRAPAQRTGLTPAISKPRAGVNAAALLVAGLAVGGSLLPSMASAQSATFNKVAPIGEGCPTTYPDFKPFPSNNPTDTLIVTNRDTRVPLKSGKHTIVYVPPGARFLPAPEGLTANNPQVMLVIKKGDKWEQVGRCGRWNSAQFELWLKERPEYPAQLIILGEGGYANVLGSELTIRTTPPPPAPVVEPAPAPVQAKQAAPKKPSCWKRIQDDKRRDENTNEIRVTRTIVDQCKK